MPSLKDLRKRISSVKSTRQITKTMKMVAAAKMRRARESCEKARPYADSMNEVLQQLAAKANTESAPLLLRGRTPVKTVRLLVFGSDRGLCGGMNTHLAKKAMRRIAKLQKEGKTVQIVTLGRKARDELRTKYGHLIVETYNDITRYINYETAENVAADTVQAFLDGHCDQVVILFNTFVSVLKQEPTEFQLVPFKQDEAKATTSAAVEYEPDEEAILAKLLPLNIGVQIFRALLESNASEQGARMSAMENATRNAGEMIDSLTLSYNRQRQAMITKELIEIISGAESV
ncbi:MAG: F0F1 ATP synthase subunit gamma [Proteobacteria bacterium]|nr:F0F1 ATP synthase subunit gamma [Pseudomonadota bacterium]